MCENLNIILIIVFCWCFSIVYSQSYIIKGRLITKENMFDTKGGLSLTLVNLKDTNKIYTVISDNQGRFQFVDIVKAKYKLRVNYFNNILYQQNLNLTTNIVNLGEILIDKNAIELKPVDIESKEERVSQKGDTVIYNANAYKTNPDATAEDLVKKMPGINVQDGKIKAHGEELKKVLVDGNEFFGDDPSLALKTLPADIVDKIQIFDKLSDQSQFSGFNDGKTEKTLNIITKSGKNPGIFGRVSLGYGSAEHFTIGGNINYFNSKERITLVGLSNNINQQNFSNQDFLGVMETSGQRQDNKFGEKSNTGPLQSNQNNSFIGQQSGIYSTHSYGINYTNNISNKIAVNGSYFFNYLKNETQNNLKRQYKIYEGEKQASYSENNNTISKNFNHRISFRVKYNIDAHNSLILVPNLNIQDNITTNRAIALSETSDLITNNDRNTDNNSNGYNFSNNLLYRHKFNKNKRTISLNLSNNLNNKTSSNQLYSSNLYNYVFDTTATVDQLTNQFIKNNTISANIMFTEPFFGESILIFNFFSGYNKSNSDKYTYLSDNKSSAYIIIDTCLSNVYVNKVYTQRGGLNYRLEGEKYSFMTGLNYQYVDLEGNQTFPNFYPGKIFYPSILPNATFKYKFNKTTNLRIFYNSFTITPSIYQLQNVIDNSNPLLLTIGNSNLKQEYSHNLISHFGTTDVSKATSFFVFFNLTYSNNHISNSTIIPIKDTLINISTITKGTQLALPINMNGYWNINSFLTYGFPLDLFKSNININAGFKYNQSQVLINFKKYKSKTSNPYIGLVFGSNISRSIDYTLSYNFNYYFANKNVKASLNNNYYNQTATARLYFLIWKGLVLNTDVSYSDYFSQDKTLNQKLVLWNVGLGYKFLKNNCAELKLTAYDILNQNKSISRTVTETYIEDNQTQILKKYFLLSIIYNLKNFYQNR